MEVASMWRSARDKIVIQHTLTGLIDFSVRDVVFELFLKTFFNELQIIEFIASRKCIAYTNQRC